MNSIKAFLLVVAVAFLFSGCKPEESPNVVTEKFMNHLSNREYKKATEYGTESTKQLLQMIETLESLGGDVVPEEEVRLIDAANIDCDIDGDTAVCRFQEDGEMVEVELVKRNGQWLVDMKKESPFGDMDWEEGDGEKSWEETELNFD